MIDERAMPTEHLKRMKVLVVDPNAYMRGVIADSLRRLMISNITSAATAIEAFTVGRNLKPDLIFVDWDAGRMSGLEFTREIRRNTTGILRETPIILLAGAIDQEQLMSARQAGINEFLLKPVSAQGVLSRIEEIVLRPRKFIDSRSYVGPCRRRKDDPHYAGLWRRLTDEPPTKDVSEQSRENALRLRNLVARLTDYAERTFTDRSAEIRGMYRLIQQNYTEATSRSDETVARVWHSLVRYIEGVGMTDTYDVEVVKLHFRTVTDILDMPDDAFLHRVTIVSDLESLISKKLHAAPEARRDVA